MNNTFNITRFSGLIKDFIIRKSIVLLMIALGFSALILAIFFKMDGMPTSYLVARKPIFLISIMIYSWISIHVIKDKIFSKEVKAHYLLIPNSNFEKWLFDLIFVVVAPIVFITFTFYITDLIALEFIVKPKITSSSINVTPFETLGFSKDLIFGGIDTLLIMCLWLLNNLLQGGLLKRLVISGMIIGAFVFVNFLLNALFFGADSSIGTLLHFPFADINMKNTHFQHDNYVFNSGFTDTQLFMYLYLPMTLLLAAIYYFKLKELEV